MRFMRWMAMSSICSIQSIMLSQQKISVRYSSYMLIIDGGGWLKGFNKMVYWERRWLMRVWAKAWMKPVMRWFRVWNETSDVALKTVSGLEIITGCIVWALRIIWEAKCTEYQVIFSVAQRRAARDGIWNKQRRCMIHDRLVTKNGFLLHTSWGLAPSPFPSGHPKNAFLGWFCNTYWITVQKRVQTIYVMGAMLICSKSCL